MVLKIFQEGPSYGYEVVSMIEEITDEYWSPSYGTIYPLIQRLEKEGLLTSLTTEEAKSKGLENSDRKYFELTSEGEEEISPKKDEEEHKKSFENLILGYLKIYEDKYGEEELERLLDDF